jgi:DNA-binding MarR family transcriptional regulator
VKPDVSEPANQRVKESQSRPPVSAICACAGLRRAARALTRAYDGALRPAGIHVTQFSVLAALAAADATISALGEHLGLDRTTLSRDLRPLEAQGLVLIHPGADQRTRVVSLTEAGRRKLREARPLWSRAQAETRAALGADGWQRLFETVEAVSAARPLE